MSWRRLGSLAARSAWALGLLAVCGAVVVGTAALPVPDTQVVPPLSVDVPAPSTVLVCPGLLRLPTEPEPGADVVFDPEFDPAPGDAITAVRAVSVRPPGADAAAGVGLRPVGAAGVVDQIAAAAAVGTSSLPVAEVGLALRGDAVGAVPAWIAGAVLVQTDAGDLRGLAAAPCQYPSAESWLVGGSTVLGSSARLVLSNPGQTAATVTVRIWGANGQVELAGAPEYLVPPGSERAVLLEGVAAEQSRIVVQTLASGGLVTAYLQDSRLAGLVPAGVDYVVSGQQPAQRQVVVGLALAGAGEPATPEDPVADDAGTDPAEPPSADPGTADPTGTPDPGVGDPDPGGQSTDVEAAGPGAVRAARLRLLAPGADAATVDLTFLGADGEYELPGTRGLRLVPGEVLDVPLDALPGGDYAVLVDADVPVVAAAMLSTPAGEGGELDRVWVPSVPLGAVGPLALPEGAAGQLLLAAVGAATVTIEVIGIDGVLAELEVQVPAATTVVLPLAGLAPAEQELAGIVIRTADDVAWAVTLTAPGDMVAALTPVPPLAPQPQVSARVR